MSDPSPRKLYLLDSYADGDGARHFTFRIDQPLARDLAAVPGQFFMLSLPEGGEAPFSYVSLPDRNGHFDALIRRVGHLTGALFELPTGAVLGYRGPFGKGWPLFFSSQRILAVAGGCGLASLAALIEAAASQHMPFQLSVVYGARRADAQVLGRQRRRWKLIMPFIETLEETTNRGRRGIPLDYLDELCAGEMPDAVLCSGPEPMLLATAEEWLQRGVPANRIWIAAGCCLPCRSGVCDDCTQGADGPIYRYDRYRLLQAASDVPPFGREGWFG